MQRPLSTRRQSIAERSTVARSWGRSRGSDPLLAAAVSDARGKCRHTHSPPQALRDSSRGGRGDRHPRGLPHGLATVSVRSNTSGWSRRAATERGVVERSIVARSWGRSREGDVLQVTAVKEKPRRHNRSPRWNRDSSRNRRGTCPRGVISAASRDLPHGLAAAPLLSFAAPPPASVRSVGLSMPLLAGNGTDFVGVLRKLHLAALPPQPAHAGAA